MSESAMKVADVEEAPGTAPRVITPEESARVLRRIDLFLIPCMVVGYGLVYYDKAILGAASLFGMTTDLELIVYLSKTFASSERLSWATSLFYFGMLAGLYPLSWALQRFNQGRVLGWVVILWSITCGCTAAITTYKGLYIQRFFLGFVESIIPTCFMCIVSSFYTQEEQALRQSWWFSSTGLFTIIGGILNYAFSRIPADRTLHSWQYLYIMASVITFLFGILCFFLPGSPSEAFFLNQDQKEVALERLRHGQTGTRVQQFKLYQLKESLLDVKTYLIFIMMGSAYTINGAVSGFGPLIVSTFGYSSSHAIFWQFPLGAICLVAILFTGWITSRIPNIRIPVLILTCLPVIAGCVMIWKSTWDYHAALPLAGYSITGFFGATVSLVISIGMSNVAGQTKKSFMAATIFVGYCVGNIVGPQLVKTEQKSRHYPDLWLGLIISYCICIIASVTLWFVLRSENKKKDAIPDDQEDRAKLGFEDLTDKENPYFRYVL